MEQNKNQQTFSEEESGFDIMEWVSNFLQHWYLFVIGLIIALSLAYMQNRKWLPSYKTAGTMIIDESRTTGAGAQALMQGFGVEAGYRNINNQVIILKSYDLISKVVDSLPHMGVEYISKGNFKTRNIYKMSPVFISPDYISPEAYNLFFKIRLRPDNSFVITVDDNKNYDHFKLEGVNGQSVQSNMFFLTVNFNLDGNAEREIFFRFRSRESLVAEFSSRIGFNYVVDGSSVLEISLDSPTPDRDIDFINQLCKTYLEDNLERKNEVANRTINFIDTQLRTVSESLQESESEITNFRRQNQLVDVGSYSGELLSKAAGYDQQLMGLKLRETYMDYLEKYLKTNMEEGLIVAPSNLGLNEPMLIGLIQQINDLVKQRDETTEKNIFHAKYTREIVRLKEAINEVLRSMRASHEIEKNEYRNRLSSVQRDIAQLPQIELEMISIERKYKMDDNYYTFFLQKRAEADILKASNTPDNKVLDKARVIAVTNTSNKSRTTMMLVLLGVLIPAVIVVLKELMNNTIRSAKDIERNTSFPLIGVVRHTNTSDPLVVSKNPRSSFTEMFRVIRTRVEFIVQRKKDIMIMITSGESGDGKTYFATNLACVYAMASQRTVLVDMDIRKPSITQRLDLKATHGVTNFLIGECDLDGIINRPPGAEFDFIQGGTVPPNAGELIRSEKLIEMFRELRRRYDFIIVDTSPIGIVADAYALALQSDVNLFVVRNEKTNKSYFKKLVEQLKQDNIQHLYMIINDVNMEEKSYSKYYSRKFTSGYGYGYGYGYTSGYTSKRKREASEKYYQYYQDDKEL